MKCFAVVLLSVYYLIFESYSAFCAGPANGQVQEYELDLQIKQENDNTKYLNCHFDGLESHLLVSKPNKTATKVKEGSDVVWSKDDSYLSCLGLILMNKSENEKLLQLWLRKNNLQDPLDIKFYISENNTWTEKTYVEFRQKLKAIRPERAAAQDLEIDISSESTLSGLKKVTESLMELTMDFYVPEQNYLIKKVKESNNSIWDGTSDNSYALSFITVKNDDETKKVGFLVVATSTNYDEKFSVYENNSWKTVDYTGFKNYIIGAVFAQKLKSMLKGFAIGKGTKNLRTTDTVRTDGMTLKNPVKVS